MLTYRNSFRFDLAPELVWDRLEQVDRYGDWWPWFSGCRLEGDGLSAGSVLRGTVTPPIPYRMVLRIEFVSCARPYVIEAAVDGDLRGDAELRLHPDSGGTRVEVAWTVEMQQPAMRLAARIGRPILQWGHDRVVEMTAAGFRRQIEAP